MCVISVFILFLLPFAAYAAPSGGAGGVVSNGMVIGLPPQQIPPGDAAAKPLFNKKLLDACTADTDCVSRYAGCVQKKCQCRPGFKQSGSACVPSSYSCPFGKPLGSSSNAPTKCKRQMIQSDNRQPPPMAMPMMGFAAAGGVQPAVRVVPGAVGGGGGVAAMSIAPFPSQWSDSCPSGSFCLVYEQMNYFNGPQEGHCCPSPSSNACPVGSPHATATCDGMSNNYCPYETHYCYYSNLPQQMNTKAQCCPNGCPSSSVSVGGDKCLPLAQLNEPCQDSLQCVTVGQLGPSICDSKKKVCVCNAGYVADQYSYCQKPYCPSTDGSNVSSPLKDDNGVYRKCTQSSQCGSENYCFGGLNLCCAKPKAVCPAGSSSTGGQSPKSCKSFIGPVFIGTQPMIAAADGSPIQRPPVAPIVDPMPVPPPNECGEGYFCYAIYSPVESDQSNGICCKYADMPMPMVASSNSNVAKPT